MQKKNSVYVNRKFNCSTAELFDWLVRPERIAQWFGPKHLTVGIVHTDVQVGGRYSIELIKSSDQTFFIEGEYIAIDAPRQLTLSFRYKGLTPAPPNSIVMIRVEQVAQSESQLFLTQEFDITPHDMAGRSDAWRVMLEALAGLV